MRRSNGYPSRVKRALRAAILISAVLAALLFALAGWSQLRGATDLESLLARAGILFSAGAFQLWGLTEVAVALLVVFPATRRAAFLGLAILSLLFLAGGCWLAFRIGPAPCSCFGRWTALDVNLGSLAFVLRNAAFFLIFAAAWQLSARRRRHHGSQQPKFLTWW